MTAKKKAVAKRGGGLPAALQKRISAQQEKFADREQQGQGRVISIKNQKFRFDGQDLGDEINVVILDYVFLNQYFDTQYDEKNPEPPVCFAIAENELEMAPVEDSPDKQSETCEGCWANEFESSSTGSGKACQNRRRLAVISAELYEDADFLETLKAENVGYLTMGGTSLQAWRSYVNRIGKTLKSAPLQVITTLSFDQSVDYSKLEFHAAGEIEDMEILEALLDVNDEIAEELRAKPTFRAEEVEETAQAPRGKKKRAVKKKAPVSKTAAPRGKKKASAAKRRSKFS